MNKESLYYIIIYLAFVVFSIMFALLFGSADPKHKLDRRWKRVLWLLSSFLAVPFIVFLVQMPFQIFNDVKKFIAGKES